MFPHIKQRVMIIVTIVVCGFVYLQGADVARAADGSDGCTLAMAAAPGEAFLWFLALSVPAVLLGTVASLLGNRYGGAFAVSIALIFPAIKGGDVQAWMLNAESSTAFFGLALDAVMWGAIVLTTLLAIDRLAGLIRHHLGWAEQPDLPGASGPMTTAEMDLHVFAVRNFPGIGGLVRIAIAIRHTVTRQTGLSDDAARVVLSGVASTLLGLMFASLFLQSYETMQVVWGLFLAFLLAVMLTTVMFPTDRPAGMLISPVAASLLVAVVLGLTGGTGVEIKSAFIEDRLWNAALGLPVYYASAGLAGAVLGIGWGRQLIAMFDPAEEHSQGESSAA